MKVKPVFVLTLEALPRDRDPSGMLRLRAVLKLLLRSFGFRCKRIDYPTANTTTEADHEYAHPFPPKGIEP